MEQIFVAGEGSSFLTPNEIIEPGDEGYESVKLNSVYRSGPLTVESDKKEEDDPMPVGYGVSIDPNFIDGICILIDYRRTDSTRVHLLLPIQQATRTFLAQIQGPGLDQTFPLSECQATGFDGSSFTTYVHTAREVRPYQEGSSTTPSFCLGPEFVLFDVSRQNINEPGSPEAYYEPYSLNANNIVPVHAQTFEGGTFYYTGFLPRLSATCPEPEEGTAAAATSTLMSVRP